MPNKLSAGTQRVGSLVDFDPKTPEVQVSLEHSDQGLFVTVPWTTGESPYARWFLPESDRPRASSGERHSPERVLFQDSHGSVLLTGCRVSGYHSQIFGGGSGTLRARSAIMGVSDDVDFSHPHGLESDISGLRAWLGRSSWRETENCRGPGSVSFKTAEVPDIVLGERNGVEIRLRLSWAIERENNGDRRVLYDYARCVTQSPTAASWDTHLKSHHAIRDLLSLSRWHDESCYEVRAYHVDDPLITLAGKTDRPQWRDVVVPQAHAREAPKGDRPHLFEYTELGDAGLLRWIELRDEYARALDPIISCQTLRNATENTLLAHCGPGVEALGYLLMLRDGASKNTAGSASLKTRLERILSDLGDCLPFDSERWVSSTCATYNGLKHANRTEPDPVDVLNAWRQCVLVTRAWVATELGIERQEIQRRLARDPQRYEYVKRP